MVVKNTESFIKESKLVHGDRYDYSMVEYVTSKIPVKIICPKHGVLNIKPNNHLNGSGCGECYHNVHYDRNAKVRRIKGMENMGKRKCSGCGLFLDRDQFYRCKQIIDGLTSRCKKCMGECAKKYRSKNVELIKIKDTANNKRRWLKYKEKHKEEIEQRKKQREDFYKERRKLAKVKRKIRVRIRDVVKNKRYKSHVGDVLGCSIEYFMFYIESQFKEGMTWNNCSYYGWHLDHIIPCAAFNLEDIEEQKKCFHYTNYQPLWRKLNQSKSSFYNGVMHGRRQKQVKIK